MATRSCESCGAEQDTSERFCTVCHAYLWWDRAEEATVDSLGGTAGATGHTVVTDPDATPTGERIPPRPPPPPPLPHSGDNPGYNPGTDPGTGTVTPPPGPAEAGPSPAPAENDTAPPTTPDRHAAAPEIESDTHEVTIGPDGAGTAVLGVTNPSTIVDGYEIVAPDAPPWLVVSGEDAHLMPAESRKIGVRLQIRGDELVLAQQITIGLEVVSQADRSLHAHTDVDVLIPPSGPAMSLSIRPSILRIQDAAVGEFVLVLDNSASNHPQTFEFAASDPEAVVRFGFDRRRMIVRPGGVEEVIVDFSAPLPDPGLEATRQLTVTGTNPEGDATATLTVVQRRSPAPVDQPLRVRLSPAQLKSVNGADADFEVQIDNRGGHSAVAVVLSARDAKNRMLFAFNPRQVTAASGQIARANARVRAAPPPRGTSEVLTFTVIASNGTVDTEAEGQVETTSTPDPMSTAALRISPQHLALERGEQRGQFDLAIDNRAGYEPLHVWLNGTSEDGAVTMGFEPAEVVVAAGSTSPVLASVRAPHPPAGQSSTRRLEFTASDGRQQVATSATITQTTPDIRPLWSRVLVIFGAIFAVVGSLLPWQGNAAMLPTIQMVMQSLDGIQTTEVRGIVEPAARIVVMALAVTMAFGLTGRAGGLTRKAAVAIVLLTVGLFIAAMATDAFTGFGLGVYVVWFGAVLGYIGGVIARSASSR